MNLGASICRAVQLLWSCYQRGLQLSKPGILGHCYGILSLQHQIPLKRCKRKSILGVEGWSCVLPFSTGTPVRKLGSDCLPVWCRARPVPSILPKEIPPPSAKSVFLTALFLAALVKSYGKLYIFVAFINLFPFQQYDVKPVVRLFVNSSVTVVLSAASWSFSIRNNHHISIDNHSLRDLNIEHIDTKCL